jgi:nucleoid-associated protein YgaU
MKLGTNKEPEEKDILLEGKSRYRNSKLLLSEGTLSLALPIFTKTESKNPLKVIHIITKGEEGKMDNISYEYYRTPYLWDRICKASEVLNPLRIKAGDSLTIPDLDAG